MSFSINKIPEIENEEISTRLRHISGILMKRKIAKYELDTFTLKNIENILYETLLSSSSIESKQQNVIRILKEINLSQYSWNNYIFSSNKFYYTRNLVIENELFELIIICWDKNSKSPIHDHPSDGCWFVGIQGQIKEEKYTKNYDNTFSLMDCSFLNEGDIAYMHDYLGYHSVGNPSIENTSITLHIYSPPVRKCKIVMENRSIVEKELNYYSKYGKIIDN